MIVGLDITTSAKRRPGTGSVVAPGPAPEPVPTGLEPLPGILDAPNVVILGASIMENTFEDGAGGIAPTVAAYFRAVGFTGTLRSYAASGHVIASTRSVFAAAKADLAATEGANVYAVHTGGNNVSGGRPYESATKPSTVQFRTDYRALMDDITATDRVIPMPLTFRHYGKADPGYPNAARLDVAHNDPVSAQWGSKPYNDNIILPAIADYAPDWFDAGSGGTAYVDPYSVGARWFASTGGDGIHGYGVSMPYHVLSRIAARARGLAPSSRAGKALIYNMIAGAGEITLDRINRLRCAGVSHLPGAFFHDGGAFDPFVSVHIEDASIATTAPRGDYADDEIADPRFHLMATTFSSSRLPTDKPVRMTVGGLFPGDTVTMTFVGVGSSSSGKADITVDAGDGATQALVLATSGLAASNQVVSAPRTVPASGEIAVTLKGRAGEGSAFFHGFGLDFA